MKRKGANLLEQLYSRDHRLPLNRKEAFYSATVLPGIIWSDAMAGFFELVGMPEISIDLRPDTTNVQFFSEYNLLDAIRGIKQGFSDWKHLLPLMTGDTPDFVIFVELATPLLVVVEAKLFDKSSAVIAEQIERQRINMAALRSVLPEYQALHVALVPESAAAEVRATAGQPEGFRTITWEGVADQYAEIPAAAYWVRLLKFALKSEPHLRAADGIGRTHEDGRMRTAEILEAYEKPDCIVRSVGCLGTANWELLKDDVCRTGGTRKWAISHQDTLPSRNYLPIKNFIEVVTSWMRSTIPYDVSTWSPTNSP